MYMWRKTYPRAIYQPVICIHGVFYYVADEVVFKRHECEWIVDSNTARHFKYNPRHLPVVQAAPRADPLDYFLAYYAIELVHSIFASPTTERIRLEDIQCKR